MLAQGSGTLLFTASTNGLRGHPNYADYNATKAGVLLLMRTIALEVAPTVRVCAVNPGYVLTPMQEREYSPAMLAEVNETIPLKRHARPEEVARWWMPNDVVFVNELPHTATGKLSKLRLRADFKDYRLPE